MADGASISPDQGEGKAPIGNADTPRVPDKLNVSPSSAGTEGDTCSPTQRCSRRQECFTNGRTTSKRSRTASVFR